MLPALSQPQSVAQQVYMQFHFPPKNGPYTQLVFVSVVTEPTVVQQPAVQQNNITLHREVPFPPKTVPPSANMQRMSMPPQQFADHKPIPTQQPMYQPPTQDSMKTLPSHAPDAYQQPASVAGPAAANVTLPVTTVNNYLLSSAAPINNVSYSARHHPIQVVQSEEKEVNSVSEAFSMAMKTLSEFSYEDISYPAGDYIPTSLSVFQSNLPMPNFHYPSAVQSNNSASVPKTSSTSLVNSTVFVAGPAVPFSEIASSQLKQEPQVIGQPAAVDISNAPLHQDENSVQYPPPDGSIANAAAIVRRGRPKKKKNPYATGDSEELATNGMIVKTDDSADDGKFTCTVCHETYQVYMLFAVLISAVSNYVLYVFNVY